MRTATNILAFSGERPPGDIVDGAEGLLAELGDLSADDDDASRLMTLEEIEAHRAGSE